MQAEKKGFNPEYSNGEPAVEEIESLRGPAILEFGAPWCGHCMAAEPYIKAAMAAYPDIPHIKVYDGKGKPLGRQYGVKLWPTLIFLQNGVEVGRVIRPREEEKIARALSEVSEH